MSTRKGLAEELVTILRRHQLSDDELEQKLHCGILATVLYLGEIADHLEVIGKQLTQIRLEQAKIFRIGPNVSLDDGAFVEIEPQGEGEHDQRD